MSFGGKFKIFILVVAAAGFILLFSKLEYSQLIEPQFKNFSLPLEKFLSRAGQKTMSFFSNFNIGKNNSLRQELNACALNFQELVFETARLQDLKKENEVLRNALNLDLQKSFSLISAIVSGYDHSPDIIFIDKGSQDGVETDFPVITEKKELVGRVIKTGNHWSEVMLLNHPGSSFVAEIFEKPEAKGVVSGIGRGIVFREVPREAQLQIGDIVITSSLAKLYPANLLVGQIESVEASGPEPFQKATIKPLFDLGEDNYIFIISYF